MRMMAADTIQSRALVALAEAMGWTRMAILTSDTDYGDRGYSTINQNFRLRNQVLVLKTRPVLFQA